jgi:hypothetical protein
VRTTELVREADADKAGTVQRPSPSLAPETVSDNVPSSGTDFPLGLGAHTRMCRSVLA